MAKARFAGKTPEELLEELLGLIVRMRVLASYPDAFVWNARKCAELLLTLRWIELGKELPEQPKLEDLQNGANLPDVQRAYFQFLQTHGNAGAHPRRTNVTDALQSQALYLLHLREALKMIRTQWPERAAACESELRRVEEELDQESIGPAIDWVNEQSRLTTTIAGLRAELDALRAARDREAPPDTAVDKQRLANEALLREEAEQRARRFELAAREYKRLAQDAERSRTEAQQRFDLLQTELAREVSARRAAQEDSEKLRAASGGVMARSLEERPRDADAKAGGKQRRGVGVAAVAFLFGVVGAVAFAMTYPSVFGGAHHPNAASGVPAAGTGSQTPAPAHSVAPGDAYAPSAMPIAADSPIVLTASAAASSSPRVDALRISSESKAWTLKLPFSMVEERRSEQRVDVTATQDISIRLYACRDESGEQHKSAAKRVTHDDSTSFATTGAERATGVSRLFYETCLKSREGKKGPHVCVRVLYRTGADEEAERLYKQLPSPEATEKKITPP